jgi:(1->4)-alpha-D-glucan 1-alpha-D-glucosylmutase
VPEEWSEAVRRWRAVNAGRRTVAGPDDDEELFLYQTLVGAWPLSPDRLETYLRKALREAKRRTSWVDPDEAHEEAVLAFARVVLADPEFRDSFEPFVDQLVRLGERITLGQVVLRLTAPGVPDIYQGDELWDLSLVDPDNRRPVDWERRRDALADLRAGSPPTRATAKLFVTELLLQLRARQVDAFSRPSITIESGPSTCAFARGDDVVVVVPTRDAPARLPVLPGDGWRNVLAPLEPLYENPPAVYERAKMG